MVLIISKAKQIIFLLIYYISPIIVSIIYWFEEPVTLLLSDRDFSDNLMNRTGSILGIFAFIWMCFNILIALKFKLIEESFSLEALFKFHITMSTVALCLSIVHFPLSSMGRSLSDMLVRTGRIGFMIFFALMVLAIIFMTNRYIKHSSIANMRAFFAKIKFSYNVNKFLHNLMLLGVVMSYGHTVLSLTVESSSLMNLVYTLFTFTTVIGWVYRKIIRSKSDPYISRKASWDILATGKIQNRDDVWALKLIQTNPSLYPCVQCGSCTATCPVSDVTKGDYNPRKLLKSVLVGSKDKILTDKEPNVWDCTQCYSCDEICPQGVKLSELFYFLRNRLAEQKEAPDGFLGEAEIVYNNGVSIPLQSVIQKRRESLNLPSRPEFDLQEIQDLMDMTGFNILVDKSNVKEGEGL